MQLACSRPLSWRMPLISEAAGFQGAPNACAAGSVSHWNLLTLTTLLAPTSG